MTRRVLTIVLLVLPSLALAQEPVDFPEEKTRCLRTELTEAGFTLGEIDDLFAGRIDDPESFVKGRIGEEGIREIARTCFPEASETPAPSPRPPGEETILTPEQRACVTQYIDEGLLDQILRREINPEGVLSRERIEEIGRACFGDQVAPPGEHPPIPPTIDLPPDTVACLRRAVGETAFNEISNGQRQPTPEEMAKGQRCFPAGPPGGGPEGIPDLPPATKQCIAGIIGQEKLEQALRLATSGGRPESVLTPEEMRKVGETCFGGAPPGAPPGVTHGGGLPPEIIACVEGALGRERVAEFLRGAPPTPDEIRKAEAAGCFPKGAAGGPGASETAAVPDLPPDVRACLEGALGPGRVAELLTGRSQPAPEEIQKAQSCFGSGGGPDPGPGPTGPPPGYDLGQCVQQCTAYDGGRYAEGDYCERACRGEPVQPPGGGEPTPYPTGEPVPTSSPPPTAEPTPYPTPDTAQCVASCTGYQKADGTTYTAEECQQLCTGGTVQGTATAPEEDPWWLRLLLRAVGL